jgi:hypothetical protein
VSALYVESLRVNPATCPVCGKRDVYQAEVFHVPEGVTWLCRHCGEGWLDLRATLPGRGYVKTTGRGSVRPSTATQRRRRPIRRP